MLDAEPLSFEGFQNLLADLLRIDPARLVPEAYFVTDLGVDSICMLQVFLRLEEMGAEVPLESAWQIQTVGEAYNTYMEKMMELSR